MTETKANSASVPRARRRKRMIHRLLGQIEKRLDGDAGKVSVADYIRLMQLEREIEEDDEKPTEIRVTWEESTGKSRSEE